MFFFLLKYEWLLLKANRLLLLLACITGLVVVLALFEGYQRVSAQRQTLTAASQQESADYARYRAQIAAAKPGQHFDGGHFGDPTNPFYFGSRMGARYAVLPPAGLAILSSGQSDLYPYYYKVTLSKKQALYHNEDPENPQSLAGGRFDLSFVIIFLLPLLIIGFTYNVYASEKEAGTLTLLMAQNIPVKRLVACRFVIRYLFFSLYFSVLLMGGLALFGVAPSALVPGSAPVFTVTLLYAAFWFSLSYWVNSLQRSSGFTATALTGAWLLAVFVLPSLLTTVADAAHPMPSRLRLITESRHISDSIAKAGNALNRFLEEHPEFKPATGEPADRNAVSLRVRLETELAMEKEKAAFTAVVEKRRGLLNRYRFLSPALFVQQDLNRAAGTNDERYLAFEKEVGVFQQTFRRFFEPLVYRQQRFTVANLAAVPGFTPAPDNRPLYDGVTLQDIAVLSALTVFFLLLAHRNWRHSRKAGNSAATIKWLAPERHINKPEQIELLK